jgi:hypothetical protein
VAAACTLESLETVAAMRLRLDVRPCKVSNIAIITQHLLFRWDDLRLHGKLPINSS